MSGRRTKAVRHHATGRWGTEGEKMLRSTLALSPSKPVCLLTAVSPWLRYCTLSYMKATPEALVPPHRVSARRRSMSWCTSTLRAGQAEVEWKTRLPDTQRTSCKPDRALSLKSSQPMQFDGMSTWSTYVHNHHQATTTRGHVDCTPGPGSRAQRMCGCTNTGWQQPSAQAWPGTSTCATSTGTALSRTEQCNALWPPISRRQTSTGVMCKTRFILRTHFTLRTHVIAQFQQDHKQ